MATNDTRKLGLVRRCFPESGFYFIRELQKDADGRAVMDKDGQDIFLHASRVKTSGFQSLAPRDVIYFDLAVSARTGKLEATNIWPAE